MPAAPTFPIHTHDLVDDIWAFLVDGEYARWSSALGGPDVLALDKIRPDRQVALLHARSVGLQERAARVRADAATQPLRVKSKRVVIAVRALRERLTEWPVSTGRGTLADFQGELGRLARRLDALER